MACLKRGRILVKRPYEQSGFITEKLKEGRMLCNARLLARRVKEASKNTWVVTLLNM